MLNLGKFAFTSYMSSAWFCIRRTPHALEVPAFLACKALYERTSSWELALHGYPAPSLGCRPKTRDWVKWTGTWSASLWLLSFYVLIVRLNSPQPRQHVALQGDSCS